MTWHAEAACNGMDPETFFPERGDDQSVRTAKAVCAGCPVILECRAENILEKDGIFGGLSGRQRREYRKAHCRQVRHQLQKDESAARAWGSE